MNKPYILCPKAQFQPVISQLKYNFYISVDVLAMKKAWIRTKPLYIPGVYHI
jgi:hypothetical protein